MSYSKQSHSRSRSPARSSIRSKYRNPTRKPSLNLHEINRSLGSSQSIKKNIWDTFREKCKGIEEEISLTYSNYEITPEEHPSYNTDWREFWNRRYRELLSEQKDPKNHDFKSEWIPFWKKQLLKYKMSEFEAKKRDLGIKMKLYRNTDEDQKKKSSEDLKEKPYESSKSFNYSENESKGKSYVGENKKRASSFVDDKFKNYKKMRKSLERETTKVIPSVHQDKTNLDMIDVLRLLTAIENQIGSVGPKINDLLSKALTLEKTSAHFSNKLLIDYDNRVLLETVKEKLIGQIMSGIVEKHHIPITHKCIDSIKYVLSNAVQLIPSNFTIAEKPSSPDIQFLEETDSKIPLLEDIIEFPVYVSGIGSFEKELFVQQLASCLITMNLSDISKSHLESIINELLGRNETKSLDTNSNSLILNNFDKGLEKSHLSDILKSFANKEEFGSQFSKLPKENQSQFIDFLKSLDSKVAPIENNLENNDSKKLNEAKHASDNSGRLSPFSMRIGRSNPSPTRQKIVQKPIFSDSDDDSSFEEEFINKWKKKMNDDNNEKGPEVLMKKEPKSTKKNDLKEFINKEDEKSLPNSKALNETKEIIANIMEQLPMKFITKHNITSTTEKAETTPNSPKESQISDIPTLSAMNSNYYSTQNIAYQNYSNFNYHNQDYSSTNFTQPNMYTSTSATTANAYQTPNNQVNTYQYGYNYSYPNNSGSYDYYQQYPGYYQ